MAESVNRSSDLDGTVGKRVPVDDTGTRIGAVDTKCNTDTDICEIHNGRQVVYFCTTHGAYCCAECKRTDHGQCTDIASLLKRKRAKLVKEFNGRFPGDKVEPVINDCAFLQDGRLLLLDSSNKKLKVFGSDFTVQYGKHFEEEPTRVKVFDENEIAVTSIISQKIYRMNANRPIKDCGTLHLDFRCTGIIYSNGNTIISLDFYNLVHYLSVEGKKLSTISNAKLEKNLQCPMDCCFNEAKSVLFVSNCNGDNVCAIELRSKKVLFSLKHDELIYPIGLDTDSDGYIYVCGNRSNNIHQLSSDGQHVGILLSLPTPKAIAFHPDGRTFVVVNKSSQVKVYAFAT